MQNLELVEKTTEGVVAIIGDVPIYLKDGRVVAKEFSMPLTELREASRNPVSSVPVMNDARLVKDEDTVTLGCLSLTRADYRRFLLHLIKTD